jgi:hypothetical protein
LNQTIEIDLGERLTALKLCFCSGNTKWSGYGYNPNHTMQCRNLFRVVEVFSVEDIWTDDQTLMGKTVHATIVHVSRYVGLSCQVSTGLNLL